MKIKLIFTIAVITCLLLAGCKKKPTETELRHLPVDSMEGVASQADLSLDKEVSFDGNGSLRLTCEDACKVRLYEIRDIDIEDAAFYYQARLRTEGVQGKAYLEMWLGFPGKGQFFSKGLNATLSGDQDWTVVEIPFFLKQGENPESIYLDLVLDGKGKVWIDDIHLLKRPLPRG